MKKIGIITYHNGKNHGACLQAYALCKAIHQLGHKAEVIDFTPVVPRKLTAKQRIVGYINSAFFTRQFNGFMKNSVPMSVHYPADYDLCQLNDAYDCFITGSDQVWNPNSIDVKGAYYLDFVRENSKKIAYAPSFGTTEFNEAQRHYMNEKISAISCISAREASGAETIKRLTGLDAVTVLDPTLLMQKQEWEKVATTRLVSEPYMFAYFNSDANMDSYVRRMSEKYKLKVVVVHMTAENANSTYKKMYKASPFDFVSLIKYAELIVADSFHGTALSIALEKPFVSYITGSGVDKRKTDLLVSLGLETRILRPDSAELENPLEIEYSESRKKLDELRNLSKQYLIKSIDCGESYDENTDCELRIQHRKHR